MFEGSLGPAERRGRRLPVPAAASIPLVRAGVRPGSRQNPARQGPKTTTIARVLALVASASRPWGPRGRRRGNDELVWSWLAPIAVEQGGDAFPDVGEHPRLLV